MLQLGTIFGLKLVYFNLANNQCTLISDYTIVLRNNICRAENGRLSRALYLAAIAATVCLSDVHLSIEGGTDEMMYEIVLYGMNGEIRLYWQKWVSLLDKAPPLLLRGGYP